MITTLEQFRQYISVTNTFNFPAFSPYLEKAAMTYTVKYVGNLHQSLQNVGSDEHESISEARNLLDGALANFAMCLYFPFYQITLGNTGPKVNESSNASKPDWWLVKDARRELLRSGHFYIEKLLIHLEENAAHFPDWNTNYKSKYNDFLVNNAITFSLYYEIFESRQTFIALLPSMRKIEDQFIYRFITDEKISRLKTAEDLTANEKKVKQYLQKAIVHLTIAKVYDQGIFHLDHQGLKLKFDVLPDEKVQAIDYGQAAEQTKRAIETFMADGTNYLMLAKDFINKNELTDYLVTTASAPAQLISGDNGIVGL